LEVAGEIDAKFSQLFHGFSKLSLTERFEKLRQFGELSQDEVDYLKQGGIDSAELAETFIENTLGYFQIPLGLATHFVIDEKPRLIPMAVEETSIIAAASKTAKWIRESGSIRTEALGREIIGQIQIAKVRDMNALENFVKERGAEMVNLANRDVASGLVRRGGGVTKLSLRRLPRPDGGEMGVIHVYADPCDAMGANIINQVCEALRDPIERATGEKIAMCILSNLADHKLVRAVVHLRGVGKEAAERIAEASLFAWCDPYRAATSNKGVMNGIDAVLVATGNDWRAVEAGVHAYAARDGQYRSITCWTAQDEDLVGEMTLPIVVGTVGGVTSLHPTARIAIKLLGIETSEDLARIAAAVGLVQNLGALRALTTVGIIEGHMKLHIRNLVVSAGATGPEKELLEDQLEKILATTKRISLQHAVNALHNLRARDISQ
jgi:hydroxymethylglutaryl-CoA reductase